MEETSLVTPFISFFFFAFASLAVLGKGDAVIPPLCLPNGC